MNYFNYFTEIEEHFQRRRGVQILLSPVDWALIESWKDAGIPLDAVLAGIDQAFEKFASGRRKDIGRLRSLVYCAPAVLDAAEAMKEAAVGGSPATSPNAAETTGSDFAPARVAEFLRAAKQRLAQGQLPAAAAGVVEEIQTSLQRLIEALQPASHQIAEAVLAPAQPYNIEDLERQLTVLDDKLLAALQQAASPEVLVELRRELDRDLARYRRNLKTEQLALLERQFLHRRLLDHYRMPRLSLFYMS